MADNGDPQDPPVVRLRAIVEAKENFVWAATMESLCEIFGVSTLGRQIAAEMTAKLKANGLACYPDPLPSQQQHAALVMLAGSRFHRGFDAR